MTIKIEIPSNNEPLVRAIGMALTTYKRTLEPGEVPLDSYTKTAADVDKVIDSDIADNSHIEATIPASQGGTKVDNTTQAPATENTSTTDSNANIDEKGVIFIPAICGNSKDPFYVSGPLKGQWKKKRGVTQEEYDKVYANALSAANILETPLAEAGTTATPTHDANTAFAQKTQLKTTMDKTPQEVFNLFSALAQAGMAEAANQVCVNHGISNGTLIFSRPDLVGVIYPELWNLHQSLKT